MSDTPNTETARCQNCALWEQPVDPVHCYADDHWNMGNCKHRSMPIARATHFGDWCNKHKPETDQ
jgi:hypothetical protein